MDLLVGIILIVLGGFLALAGLRVFFFALPIMGFIVGMAGGLALMDHLFDNSFLSTTTGISSGNRGSRYFVPLLVRRHHPRRGLHRGQSGDRIDERLQCR
jgi:hypothetical protein